MYVKKVLIIVNPHSGMGLGKRLLSPILEWIKWQDRKNGMTVDVELSSKTGPKSIASLAGLAIGQYDRVVVVGGDGTVNNAADILVGSGVSLGIVRGGSGNDFAKTLQIPRDPWLALDVAVGDNIIPIDVGRVNGKIFVNLFGIGFDAKIARSAESLKERGYFLPSTLIYLSALLKELFTLEYHKLEAVLEEETEKLAAKKLEGNVTMVAVANGPYCGGVFTVAPDADLTDGKLDICWIKKAGRVRILRFLGAVMKGAHLGLPEVEKDGVGKLPRASSLTIVSSDGRDIPCHMDGEILPAEKEYKIDILPKALSVAVPYALAALEKTKSRAFLYHIMEAAACI